MQHELDKCFCQSILCQQEDSSSALRSSALCFLPRAVWEMYTGESLYSNMCVGQILYAVAYGKQQPQVHSTEQ